MTVYLTLARGSGQSAVQTRRPEGAPLLSMGQFQVQWLPSRHNPSWRWADVGHAN